MLRLGNSTALGGLFCFCSLDCHFPFPFLSVSAKNRQTRRGFFGFPRRCRHPATSSSSAVVTYLSQKNRYRQEENAFFCLFAYIVKLEEKRKEATHPLLFLFFSFFSFLYWEEPPEMVMTWPLTQPPSSEERKATTRATSSGVAQRLSGQWSAMRPSIFSADQSGVPPGI